MPTYEYRCTECGEDLEVVQKFSDEPLKVCPACQGALRKVFSPVGIVFKGSGFYRTDSRKGAGSDSGSGDGAAKKDKEPAGTKSSDSSSSDSGKPSANGSSSGSDSSSSSSSGSSSSGSSSSGSSSSGSSSSGKSGKSSSGVTPAASKAG